LVARKRQRRVAGDGARQLHRAALQRRVVGQDIGSRPAGLHLLASISRAVKMRSITRVGPIMLASARG
jgi:hypothetical protein